MEGTLLVEPCDHAACGCVPCVRCELCTDDVDVEVEDDEMWLTDGAALIPESDDVVEKRASGSLKCIYSMGCGTACPACTVCMTVDAVESE